MAVKPIPDGFHSVTPHIVVKGAEKALDFYAKAFGAKEIMRMPGPDGKGIMHAEITIGDSIVMIADEFPQMGVLGPQPGAKSPVTIHLYVKDCDATFKQATAAGATIVMPPVDMFWGDRYSTVTDPFGHSWSIATHTSDPTPEEMQAAMAAMGKDCGGQ